MAVFDIKSALFHNKSCSARIIHFMHIKLHNIKLHTKSESI